jgi:hypothetical protein
MDNSVNALHAATGLFIRAVAKLPKESKISIKKLIAELIHENSEDEIASIVHVASEIIENKPVTVFRMCMASAGSSSSGQLEYATRLGKAMHEADVTIEDLSTMSGVGMNTLYELLLGEFSPTELCRLRIAKVLPGMQEPEVRNERENEVDCELRPEVSPGELVHDCESGAGSSQFSDGSLGPVA